MQQELQAFTDWLSEHVRRQTGRSPAPNTLRTKRSRVSVCCTVMGLADLESLGTLIQDRGGVNTLLDKLALRQSSGAMRSTVWALRDFAGYSEARGWSTSCALLPTDTPPPNPPKPVVVYAPEEVKVLLDTARGRGLRWWLFLLTIAETGRRVGEVLNYRWDQLNLSAPVPHFNLPTTKNGRQQYAPLTVALLEAYSPETVAALQTEVRAGTQRQFGRSVEEHPFPWTESCVTKMLQRHCARVGVPYRGFHCLRHTKATDMLARGVPIQAVSALLGHANVATTDRFYNHATALSYARYLES